LEDKLLLTSYVPNASNVVQLLNTETRPRKLELLEEASGLLHRLHKHEDTAWGDPWFGNVMLDGNEMLLHDFGFYPSNIHDKKYLFARDLLGLAVSGKFRSGLDAEEVVEVMLRHYRIDTDMKNAINHAIEYDEKQYRNPAMRLIKSYIFNNFVFGMTEKEVMPVKREVLAQL
jgi:tRNA A-37 threonylcarbamoyl transferase component Bud32